MKSHSSDRALLSGLFFKLLPYQILLLIVNAGNSIVDSLCASNFIGQNAMKALGLYAPMDHFLYAVSIMLVSGSQILCGKFLGSNQKDSVNGIFSMDLLISAGIGLLSSLLLVLATLSGAARELAEDVEEISALNSYILGQSIGYPALIMGQQLFAFLSLENQTRRTMAASLTCVVVNAASDLLFVAVLKMGTFGLGLASAIAIWAFFGVQAYYYLSGKSEIRFSFRHIRPKESIAIFRQGYSGAISRFVEMFRCFIVNTLIIRYVGSVGLSAFAAVNSVMAVFWPVPFGMLAVTRLLLSVSLGEEDRRSIVNIMHVAITRGVLITCGLAVGLCLLAEPITRMFFRDPSDPVYQLTVSGFRILPFCMPFAIVSLDFAGYAQATGKKLMSIVLPVLDGMVFVVLFSLVLIPAMGMPGLYISNVLNGVMCCLTICVFAWVELKRVPRTLEDLLMIPPSFGVPDDARIDISVREMKEVVLVSEQVMDFCLRRGIDMRRAAFAGLALEEMAGNVVEHGFTESRGRHSIDIRVVHKENDIILRLRDNCVAFNPSEVVRIMEPEDPAKNAGIRIVYGLARDIRYQNLLGANVFTARF